MVNNDAAAAAAAGTTAVGDGGDDGTMLEYWYSSGGYTKVPASLQEQLAAGKAIVIEAGALLPASANSATGPEGLDNTQSSSSSSSGVARPAALTRWLLCYRAADGRLESARLERYQL
jgi:hypothetical protein